MSHKEFIFPRSLYLSIAFILYLHYFRCMVGYYELLYCTSITSAVR